VNGRGGEGWSIYVGGDHDQLNFLIYAACAFGLIEGDSGIDRVQPIPLGLKEGDSAISQAWPDPVVRLDEDRLRLLREQWRHVWDRLLRSKADTLFTSEFARAYAYLDPPLFDRIEQPELRECFRQAWPGFIRWWSMPAGGYAVLTSWEEKPDLRRYVERFEREAGRWIRPFRLRVDLVYAGVQEPLLVADNYFVMAPDRRYFWNEDWWLRLFRERY